MKIHCKYFIFNHYFTGINDALDNDDNILYFGNNKHQTRGFNGCLDNLKIDDIPVSMDGKSTIAKRIAFEKIEFKCQARLDDAGVCSSQPCLNGGTCLEHPGSESYQCTCNQPRYQGSQCELDRFVHTAKRIPEIDPKLLQLFQNLTTDSLLMYNGFFCRNCDGEILF